MSRYDADDGFFLNEDHFKVRGFCDHNNFGVVGMAVPSRINLYRAQASRAVGGNGRRTSHNPSDAALLEIYDRLGVVVIDENRLFANETRYVENMGVLVKRDRNHPSVVIWSFCNEAGCEGDREAGGPRFREIAYRYDGTRPTLANMFTFGDLLSETIDVQGFSHESRAQLDACHAQLPSKPIYMSECCSCNTMRDEDEGCETTTDNPHEQCTQKSFNARCAQASTNASDGARYAVGTMIWTLFDYYGEPSGVWPEVSSSYGQFDLAGFPKAAAHWYRTEWLLRPADGPDKPFATSGAHAVRLVETWEPPSAFPSTRANKSRDVHVYTSAPAVELFVNGVTAGVRHVSSMGSGGPTWAEWAQVPWESGTIVARALDADGRTVATDQRVTNGAPTALMLTLDAPSERTGTGTALVADGHDAALVRASVVDASGAVVWSASHNVTFRVASGPGEVLGAHNGDVRCHEPSGAHWRSAYHGLVRAVVRVTSLAARRPAERALMATIDTRGRGALRVGGGPPPPIVLEASAPGLGVASLSIDMSTDEADSVLRTAATAAGRPLDLARF